MSETTLTIPVPVFRPDRHETVELPVLAVESRERYERLYVPTPVPEELWWRVTGVDAVLFALGFVSVATAWSVWRLSSLGKVL